MSVTFDVRPIPPAVRHDRIYAALDRLVPGETLERVAEHRRALTSPATPSD